MITRHEKKHFPLQSVIGKNDPYGITHLETIDIHKLDIR